MGAKDNNKGFSLLELLVAVAILAVIVAPFLMAFFTTTKINMTTKEQQRAKFAATNVMEDIRSRDISSILREIESRQNDDKIDSDLQSVIGDDGLKEDNSIIYTTLQESDGEMYTVEATLDPNSKSDDDESTDYNALKMANIYGMNTAYDAFYELDAATDNSKIEQLAEIRLGNRDDEKLQQIYHTVNREIILTINYQDEKHKSGADVSVQSVYSMPSASGANVDTVATQEQIIYSDPYGTLDNPNLENIYLFYNPLYNGTSRQARETITVVNNTRIPCSVYLCKQKWPTDTTSNVYKDFPFIKEGYCDYDTNEKRDKNYLVNVRVSETERSEAEYGSNIEPNVFTTIRTNIDDIVDDINGERTKGDYDAYKNVNYGGAHMKLMHSNGRGNYEFAKTINNGICSAGNLMGISNLAGAKETNYVYHVTVKAYKGIGKSNDELASTIESKTQ